MKIKTLGIALSFIALPIGGTAAEIQRGGSIDVAIIGEPPTLDPMMSTADIVGTISQHIYETLYAFDSQWNVVPLLAETMPEITNDGKTYIIHLRDDITFHDGTSLTAADVVASFNRWQEVSTRGRQVDELIQTVSAESEYSIRLELTASYSPLLSLLAFNAGPVIMPEEAGTGSLTEFIGTGPYMLKEHRPDQYIQLARFEDYVAREEASDGYGGARHQYLDEIRFIPISDPNTRVEGAVAGQFDYISSIPTESVRRLDNAETEPLILESAAWPVFRTNMQEGILSDVTMRRAVAEALDPQNMLIAAFGSEDFYALNGALYPEGHRWYNDTGLELYGEADPAAASELLEAANYDGTPIRILTSRQYNFHYNMAVVAEATMEAAGMNVDVEVVDWATLTQRRQDPALWDIYITHSPFQPDPALVGLFQSSNPGWWDSQTKEAAFAEFAAETETTGRLKLFADLQALFYDELPGFKVGDFHEVSAIRPELKGVVPAQWPYFWNAYLEE